MGRHRTSYKNSLLYAKELINNGEDIEIACKLSAHRFDEKSKQIYRRLKKEERNNKIQTLFYEGPIYLVNIKDKKDIKKKNIAIKLNTKFDKEKTKLYIENFYTKDNFKGIIKSSDWNLFSISFNTEEEYNKYISNKKNT